MHNAQRYAFTTVETQLGEARFRPNLPLTLAYQDRSVAVSGLLDTGAVINVLPYQVGIDLGVVWEEQTIAIRLTGNLARYEARILIVQAVVGRFESVPLVFAWSKAPAVPLLLGQVNFFMQFDACFYRSELYFEVRPHQTPA